MHCPLEVVILSTNLEWRRSVARVLDANGVDFACASSIRDCQEIVARDSVRLIFWDSHLEDGNYQHLVQAVGALDRRVKIVVMSHHADWSERAEAAQNGAFGVLPFPCEPTEIEWVLSRAARADHPAARAEVSAMRAHA